VTAAAEAWHTAGLGYSGPARRSGGSGQTAGGQATAASVSRARSNTGCAAAAAVAAAAVAAVADAVALLHGGQYADKQSDMELRVKPGPGKGTSGHARARHRVTNGRRVPLLAVAGRHCVLRADIPRAW